MACFSKQYQHQYLPLPVYEVPAIRVNTTKSTYTFTSVLMYLCLLFLTDDCGTANMTGHRGLQHSLSVVVPRLVSVKCLSIGLILLLSFYFAWMTVTRQDVTGRYQYGLLQHSLSVVVPRLVSVQCLSVESILFLSFYFAWMTVTRLDGTGRHQYDWLQHSLSVVVPRLV